MEFPFDCEKVLSINPNSDKIAILDSQSYSKLVHPTYSSSMSNYQRNLSDILDKMGEASSKVQLNSDRCRHKHLEESLQQLRNSSLVTIRDCILRLKGILCKES